MVHEGAEETGVGERKQWFYELQTKSSTTKFSQENNVSGIETARSKPVLVIKGEMKLKLVKVWFSAGCQNFVHLLGKHNDHQIIPSPDPIFDSGGVIGDDQVFNFFFNRLMRPGDRLEFEYKNSDTNDHSLGIFVEAEPVLGKRVRKPEVVITEQPAEPAPEDEPTASEARAQAEYKKEVKMADLMPNPDELIDGLEHE